jgi:hypothetical protein
VPGRSDACAGRIPRAGRDPGGLVLKILLIVAVIAVVVFLVVPALRRRSGTRRGL